METQRRCVSASSLQADRHLCGWWCGRQCGIRVTEGKVIGIEWTMAPTIDVAYGFVGVENGDLAAAGVKVSCASLGWGWWLR